KEELLKKYDTEANTRNVRGITAGIVFALLIAFSLFQLYTGIFGQYTAYIQRTVHLGFALTLIFLLFPATKRGSRHTVTWYYFNFTFYCCSSLLACLLRYSSATNWYDYDRTISNWKYSHIISVRSFKESGRNSNHDYCDTLFDLCLLWTSYAWYFRASRSDINTIS